MVDFGTIVLTSLMTARTKVLQQNEAKTEIEMYIVTGNGIIEYLVKN